MERVARDEPVVLLLASLGSENLLDSIEDVGMSNRFAQVCLNAQLSTPGRISPEASRGHHYDYRSGEFRVVLDSFSHSEPVHIRHLTVEEYQRKTSSRRLSFFQGSQRCLA